MLDDSIAENSITLRAVYPMKQALVLFARDATPAVEIIRATPEDFAGTNQYDMPSVPTWHRDALIIVGDVAHAVSPSSGQGASMACEDSIVLAQCLRDLPDTRRAFAAYERLRRERVERVVAYGRVSAAAKPLDQLRASCATCCSPCSSSGRAAVEAAAHSTGSSTTTSSGIRPSRSHHRRPNSPLDQHEPPPADMRQTSP
jgi:hypothetical protein